jgi:hypothetical protein
MVPQNEYIVYVERLTKMPNFFAPIEKNYSYRYTQLPKQNQRAGRRVDSEIVRRTATALRFQ